MEAGWCFGAAGLGRDFVVVLSYGSTGGLDLNSLSTAPLNRLGTRIDLELGDPAAGNSTVAPGAVAGDGFCSGTASTEE